MQNNNDSMNDVKVCVYDNNGNKIGELDSPTIAELYNEIKPIVHQQNNDKNIPNINKPMNNNINANFHKDMVESPYDVYEAAITPQVKLARECESSYDEAVGYIADTERHCNAEFADHMARLYYMQLCNILEYQTQLRALSNQLALDKMYDIVDKSK